MNPRRAYGTAAGARRETGAGVSMASEASSAPVEARVDYTGPMPAARRRSRFAASVTAAVCLLIALAVVAPAGQRADPENRLDLIFEPWSVRGAPGCAVSVMRGGDILFAKGYGEANLEYDVPITPASVFHVASVSMQFTALAVALLVADGRVS